MPIINRGVFDLNTVYLREVGNDWPTAQVLYTQDVLETAGNLYYTNARVVQTVTPLLTTANVVELAGNLYFTNARVIQTVTPLLTTANVIESGSNLYYTNARVVQTVTPLLTTANVVELAGNLYYNEAKVRPLLTTANVTESTANLYFTTERARSAYTAGLGIAISANGVISSKGDDTGLGVFNAGINLANALILSNNFANLITFDNADGLRHLVYSLHLTNFSNQTAYVTGRYVSGSNTILFSNLFEMPASSFVEYQVKPQIFYPGDQIQFRSFSSPNQAANNLVSALVSYQASQDTNFIRVANVINNNNNSNIFTTTARTTIFEGIKIVNPNPADIPVSVWIADNNYNIFAFLAANVVVPSFSSIELCDYPKALREDFTIRARKNSTVASNPLNFFLSGKYTTQYTITPSTEVMNEGSTVTFNVDTLNLGNGTTLYYTLSFYSNSLAANDFVTNVSGSAIVTDNRATIQITANTDVNTFDEGDETFRLQLRKNSISGPILTESANVIIRNTSNVQGIQSVNFVQGLNSGTSIVENTNVVISINTANFGNNTVLYYTTTGNVTSSSFLQGNAGTITVVDNSANLILTANNLASGTQNFVLEIRRNSITGTPLYVSGNLLIIDSALAFTTATGGVQSNVTYPDGNYRIHAYTTSGTFTVSRRGEAFSNVEYLVVAGGGASGQPDVSPGQTYGGAAGGGAGGLLTGNATLTTTGSFAMVVGAGGANPGVQGSNSSIFSNTIIAIGGGFGGALSLSALSPLSQAQVDGKAGGSGGGAGSAQATPTTTILGVAGVAMAGGTQGSPGASSPALGRTGGGGGAGGTSSSPTSWARGLNGRVVSWVPSSYGANITGVPLMGEGQAFSGGGAGTWADGTAPQVTPVISAGGFKGGFGGGGSSYEAPLTFGNVNTGGGAAGGSGGGSGGSGIIILRYRVQ